MASSRKPAPSASALAFLQAHQRKRIAIALSDGMDSVVLLHLLKNHPRISAIHVHHRLSPNADAWAAFCRELCSTWKIPLKISRVKVRSTRKGIEAAARETRYEAFRKQDVDVVALTHHLDDQAETVLMNLLRGAGLRNASGMRPLSKFRDKVLAQPLLEFSRED